MKTKLALLCAGILITTTAWAETSLDIETAVKIALEKNLSLERSRMENAAAKRKRDRAWNSLIPSLGAGAVAAHPASMTGPVPAEANVWTPGFSLSASVQLSPSVIADIERTKEDYEAGLLNYAAARQDLELQVRRLYYQLLLLRSNTELAEQNAASAQSRYGQIRAQQRTGQVSNLDELSARLDVQTQQTNVKSTLATYNNTLDNLKYLLMIPPEEDVVLQGSLHSLSVADHAAEAGTAGETLAVAALRKTISSLEAQRKGLWLGAYTPSLNLSWNASPLYSSAAKEWTDSGQFSVTLLIKLDNFLPWSQAKDQIDALGDNIAAQQSLLRESAMSRQNTLQALQRNYIQSMETIKLLLLNAAVAEETYAMYEEVYRRGATDLQSLYSVRDSVSLAQNKLAAEQYNPGGGDP